MVKHMGLDFDPEQAYHVAIKIEENGAKFYRMAIDLVDDPEKKKLLASLAGWEDEHKDLFIKLRDDISDLDPMDYRGYLERLYEPTDEQNEIFQLLADANVFPIELDPSDLLKGDETLIDILRIALNLEKDAVIFYMSIQGVMKTSGESTALNKIIKEEMRHIAILNRELASCGTG